MKKAAAWETLLRRLTKKDMSNLKEALQYYYHAPVEFVEDIIRVKPDDNPESHFTKFGSRAYDIRAIRPWDR